MVSNNDKLILLVTGAGAPGIRGTLHALRNNPDGRRVRIVGVDTQTKVVGALLADRFYTVPPPESTEYIESLREICRQENVAAVLPQTTREIAKLAVSRTELEQAGVRVMVSDPSAIAAANDKGAVVEVFRRLDLPAPLCLRATTEAELIATVHQLGYPGVPAVVKPPVSNGMRGVRILREEAWDVHRFLTEKPQGLEISLDELIAILRRGRWPEVLVVVYFPPGAESVESFFCFRFSSSLPPA